MLSKTNICSFLLISLLAFSATTKAITIDFNDSPGGLYNFDYGDVRFSARCIFIYHPSNGYLDSGYIATNPSGCVPGPGRNENFLGEDYLDEISFSYESLIYVDYSGRPFSLESVFAIAGKDYMGNEMPFSGISVTSSKGPVAGTSGLSRETSFFNGPNSKGISWVIFEIPYFGHHQAGIDNLELRIPMPEPHALSLMLIGAAGVVVMRRKHSA